MAKLHQHLEDPRKTPQSRPVPGREAEMEKNLAGGHAFKAGDWIRLDRFLILGSEGGTFYASEKSVTRENADVVRRCLRTDWERTLSRIVEVSVDGLAPKNSPAILALALAFSHTPKAQELHRLVNGVTLRLALQHVCRTGTHLMEFLDAATSMRGGGRALNGAVRDWLASKDVNKLAYQMTKYRQRGEWTWRNILRRYRPNPGEILSRQTLYRWAVTGDILSEDKDEGHVIPENLMNFLLVQATGEADLAACVRDTKAPWEWIKDSKLTARKDVLEALFENMPIGATIRQLSKLTAHGVLPEKNAEAVERITNVEAIRKGRVHPVSLFLAQKAYEKGTGRHLTWTPQPAIIDALEDGFRLAMVESEPITAKVLIALDTSGSMGGLYGSNASNLPASPMELGAAMALALNAQCIRSDVIGFDAAGGFYGSSQQGWVDVPLSPRMRCVDAVRAFSANGGGTDCSLPFRAAQEKGGEYDAVIVFTDNMSWAGDAHAYQALVDLRKTSPKCRAVWCAMTATGVSLGDPKDDDTLNIAGFSSDVPKIISDFVARRF